MNCEPLNIEELKKLRRPIPTYEGFYSIRGDGAVFSEERIVEKSDGKKMRVKEKQLKEVPNFSKKISKGKTVSYLCENSSTFKFSVEGERKTFTKSSLLKMVFPELYPPVDDLDGEEWRVIADHPKYMVSNKGRVKKIKEIKTNAGIEYIDQESLRHIGTVEGYPLVTLPTDNNKNNFLLGRVVFEAFHRKLNKDEHVQYKDGNIFNVFPENLIAKYRLDYRDKDDAGRFK